MTVAGYTLGRLLGRGGMSEVYAASHPTHGDALALKLLRVELTSDAKVIAAFLGEAAQTRRIHHPNVVRIHDANRDAGGQCYVVMDRVDGEDLATRLRARTLTEDEARAMFAAIADGMEAVHTAGIVHRDLKPANVMLRGSVPLIVDFGIAKSLGAQSALATGRRIGTPAYMAPEQLTGGLIAPCVDVWALGVMMFEAVTGSLPFDDFAEGRAPQLFETAPRALTRAAISPALDHLIARCLERDPGKRARSMEAIARELRGEADVEAERVTQDAGALLAPPALLAPAPMRARRWPWAIGATAVVALVAGALAMRKDGDAAASATKTDADVSAEARARIPASGVSAETRAGAAQPAAGSTSVPAGTDVSAETRAGIPASGVSAEARARAGATEPAAQGSNAVPAGIETAGATSAGGVANVSAETRTRVGIPAGSTAVPAGTDRARTGEADGTNNVSAKTRAGVGAAQPAADSASVPAGTDRVGASDRRTGKGYDPFSASAETGALLGATQVAAVPAGTGRGGAAKSASLVVEVRSQPAGAQILVGGRSVGVTPKRLDLPGPASLVVRRAGYRTANIRAERAGALDVRLVPLPKKPRESLD